MLLLGTKPIIRGGCVFTDKIDFARDAGAQAVIIYNDGTAADRMGLVNMRVTDTTIPAAFVAFETGMSLKASLDEGESPVFTLAFVSNENSVASFSSRGPNMPFSPDVIKPDIIAPGIEVLAAEAPLAAGGVSRDDFGYRDGTSMASPHVAGFMALMRQAYPDWSPSALKSAMMTTARQNIRRSLLNYDQASPLEIGSGFPVINAALDPGLVYEISVDEHRAAYCGFDEEGVGKRECKTLAEHGISLDSVDLNYPSISVSGVVGSQVVSRIVTNVAPGAAALHFNAILESPPEFDITISPCEFVLEYGESLSFEVTIESTGTVLSSDWLFGSLTWQGEELAQLPDVRPQDSGTSLCSTKEIQEARGYRGGYQPTRKRYLRTGVSQLDVPELVQDNVAEVSPAPTSMPVRPPTSFPSAIPTQSPSDNATASPSDMPTQVPSDAPSTVPTSSPPVLERDPESITNVDTGYKVYSPIAVKFNR